ncbi:MAG: leucine-rich repeat domain-containing protein [Dehalococcoidia bacterium]
MKRISVFLIAVVLITGVVGFGGCNEEANEPAIFTYAGNTTVMSQTISPMGGTIEAGHSGTPIDGIEVEFPEGALTEDTNISLGYNTGTLTPNEGIYAGVAFTIDTGNVSQFGQAVIVKAPFENIDGTPVPYYVDSDGRLHPTLLLEVDRATETFTFAIFHASTFTWIVSLLAGSETLSTTLSEPVILSYETGYYPAYDSFQIDNEETEYTEGGECFGMSAFSTWYYMQKKYQYIEGNLYPNYMEKIDTDADGNPLYGQDIIATRAHIAISQVWDTVYSGPVGSALTLSDADKWASITSAMENTAGPVLIYLQESIPFFFGPHAVAAYAYNNHGHLFIYDPNHEGEEEYIEYDIPDRSFHWYGIFDDLALLGDYHSITDEPEEPYENILEDADANFHGSGIATIDVTSHSQGQAVDERNIVLRGKIHSSQVLITELKVYRGFTQLGSTKVGYSGSFSLSVSLESGFNSLYFITKGKDDQGDPIQVPNSMSELGLLIIVDEEPIYFPDPNLRAAIREAISKPTGDIYPSDLEGLTELDAAWKDIANLTGLEYCGSLTSLVLAKNQISDISALSNLTSLEVLSLEGNQINEISPLSNLTSLTFLALDSNPIDDISPLANLTTLEILVFYDNPIEDISPLVNLTNLTDLGLEYGQISDISPLVTLTNLEWLSLVGNQIEDISPLTNLTNLTHLHLGDNEISDIEALVDNPGLAEGDRVYLYNNPLNSDSINIYIPQLEARGVDVYY